MIASEQCYSRESTSALSIDIRDIYFPRVPGCVSLMMRGRVESHGRRSFRKPLSSVSPGGFKSPTRADQIVVKYLRVRGHSSCAALLRVCRNVAALATSARIGRGGIDADEDAADAVLRLRRHAPAERAL